MHEHDKDEESKERLSKLKETDERVVTLMKTLGADNVQFACTSSILLVEAVKLCKTTEEKARLLHKFAHCLEQIVDEARFGKI